MITHDSRLSAALHQPGLPEDFPALVERHIDFVYSSALRQTGDPHLAQDVTQAVFLLLCRRASRLKPGTVLKGWLFNATRYVVANARRSEARRKFHEREAAAMRSEKICEEDWARIEPHLDDALAGLSEKDRRVLMLRFFEDLPMADLGNALGISENAAQKRVAHALSRLRHFLVRRGAAVSAVSLGGILQTGVAQAAPADLAKATINLVLHTESNTLHSSPAFTLAKGASKMMIHARAKLLAIQGLIAGLTIGTGVLLAAGQLHSVPPDRPIAMANQTDVPTAIDPQYEACCQVLKSIVAGYDRNDAAAVQAQFYYKPGTDPKAIDNMYEYLQADVVAYRLANSAVSRFGFHGAVLNIGLVSTNGVMIIDVLSRISPKNAQLRDDALEITPAVPTGPYVGCWQSPIYFVRDQGTWKFDAARNLQLTFRAIRRHPIAGESPADACAAGIHLIVARFNAIADDIDHGKIPDEVEAKKRINAAFTELNSQFRECQFSANHN